MKRFLLIALIVPAIAVCSANAAAQKKSPKFNVSAVQSKMSTFVKVFYAYDMDNLEEQITQYAFKNNLDTLGTSLSVSVQNSGGTSNVEYFAIATFKRK